MTNRVRAIVRILTSAPLLGGLYMLALYAAFVTEPLVPANEILLGKDASQISSYVAIHFGSVIRTVGQELALAAFGVGAALGTIASLLVRFRDRVHGRPAASVRRAALEGAALVAALHLAAVLASMARWPQIYAPFFWTAGGARASLQRLVTDRLGPSGVTVALLTLLFAYLVGAPTRWGALSRRPRALGAAIVLVLGLGGVAFTGPAPARGPYTPPPPPPEPTRPKHRSIVILAADGLRDDRVRTDITPTLSALASRGTRFDRAYVDIPRTLASWTTILTGLHPHHHRVRSAFPRFEDVHPPPDTLTSRLRGAGYRTIAVSDYAGDIFRRYDFGVSDVRVPPIAFPSFLRTMAVERSVPLHPFLQTSVGRSAFPEVERWNATADPRFVARKAIAALRDVHDEPFFMVVFFSTTHFPYAAPAPYHQRFTRPDYGGPFRYDKTVAASVPINPDADDVQQIRGLYDGAVAAVDDASRMVLDELAATPAGRDAIVLVTSDHGEVLFEHERWHGHGDHFFGDEGTHVPLVIVDPRLDAASRRERALVSNVDIAPTLYDLAGLPVPSGLDGRSIAPAVRGEPIAPRAVFAETELMLGENPGIPAELRFPPMGLAHLLEVDTEHGDQLVVRAEAIGETLRRRHRMVRDERWKLIYMPTSAGPRWRLVDTVRDPEELVDLSSREPDELARMKALLWSWMLEDPLVRREGDALVPVTSP
ncbi:MAG: sulfatase [Deltaproteobacteria bacterium]|nr:sulfatase [Deltaproteobacteria bacterium]